ncbi:hypothetical protein [Mycolicibacterium brisbanense]
MRNLMPRVGAAVAVLGLVVAGCAEPTNKAPTTTPTTTSTTPPTTPPTAPPTAPPSAPGTAPAPTEKGIDPSGGNRFTPTVLAPAAPTEPPGVHRNH